MNKDTIWVVDDDQSIRRILLHTLQQAQYDVRCFADSRGLLRAFAERPPALVIADIRMPRVDGIALLQRIKAERPALPVIIMTAYTDLAHTVAAFEGGVFEYLTKPFDVDAVVALVRRALQTPIDPVPISADDGNPGNEIIGSALVAQAAVMQEVFSTIAKLSRSSMTVLITGESGTGKELIARALHQHSPRAKAPMLSINTAAIPAELLESELFGHEKGAFTGATAQRLGYFEQASGGTLFLDEIGDMPLSMQTRLLRVLAEGELHRVGGTQSVCVDVRVIAATHRDLSEEVEAGRFREDLLHRLAVVRLRIPPLRERKGDIVLLARHFLRQVASELGGSPKTLSRDAMDCLTSLPWPGNVRQLANVCRWLSVMTPGSVLYPQDFPVDLFPGAKPKSGYLMPWQQALQLWIDTRLEQGQAGNLAKEATAELERTLLDAAMRHAGGEIQEAARLLGWSRNTASRKLRR